MSDAENTTVTKTCTQCHEEKIIAEFIRDRSIKCGYKSKCKKCLSLNTDKDKRSEYLKSRYELNKEEILAKQKVYYESNKEAHKSRCKSWREANKERISATISAWNKANKEKLDANRKVWREANKEHIAATTKAWSDANKERHLSLISNWSKEHPERVAAKNRNRRARKKLSTGTHTESDIQNLFTLQNKKCAVCNKLIVNGYHVDHVIALANGGSNDKSNLQLLCAYCNLSKGTKDPIDFMRSRGKLL